MLDTGMPASTLEPVNAALRNALSQNSSEDFTYSQLAGSSRRILQANIEFESTDNYQNTVLKSLKSKYIVLHQNKSTTPSKKQEMSGDETLTLPQRVLYPLESVQLGWNNSDWSVGAGMINMGNTCYLNSTLQALFHVPALVNWLMSDKPHMAQCEVTGNQSVCIICALNKTLHDSQQRNANAIRPWPVYSNLRSICRHFVPGRQEDAHEFLRYLVEAMERAYIQRFRHITSLDTRSKETTPLNQILGGYLRSAVQCLECKHVSTTFQHFQDLLLDIRKVNTLDDALDLYFSREKLDDMAYHCENCQKKVLATKQFTLERAPMVLCIQLKRFSVANNKITKHVTFRQRLELTRFARRKSNVPLLYRLVSLVTHVGQTVSCGHYTAVAQAPSGNFYQFDDSMVRPIPQQSVFSTNAYIMLYELECSQTTSSSKSSAICKNYNKPTQNVSMSPASPPKESTTPPANSPTRAPHLLNGICFPKPPNSLSTHATSYSQNGNARCNTANGIKHHHSDSASDSDEAETTNSLIPPQKNKPQTPNTNAMKSVINTSKLSLNAPSTSHSSDSSTTYLPKRPTDNIKEQLEKPTIPANREVETKKNVNSNSESSTSNEKQLQKASAETSKTTSQPVTKLVPYEVDESSCSAEESPPSENKSQVATKAVAIGSWQVSPNNTFHGPSLEGQTSWNRRQREAVTELMQQSHEGYSAPVSSWNGTRAALDREINNDRREERKRAMMENNSDKVKMKQPKHNNSYMGNKPSPGYNPFQEYSNRKWHTDTHYYKPHYSGMRNRYRHGNIPNRHRDKFRN